MVRDLVASGRHVFLDLKYHDIPNTVAAAVREAAALGVRMLTVHASGGGKMLRAAADAARAENPATLVLAVTVLTSMDEGDLQSIGVENSAARSGAATGVAGLDARLRGHSLFSTRSFRAPQGAGSALRDCDSGSASRRQQRRRPGSIRDPR